MKRLAPAKINLSLRILGRREDGYHDLETLMLPLTLADEVTVEFGSFSGTHLACNDPALPTDTRNLAVLAAEKFRVRTKITDGIHITLTKKIPAQAGLGGGSSDAAAVLKILNQLLDFPLDDQALATLALELGSDVPFFLAARPSLCRGRGEQMTAVEFAEDAAVLLIKPPFGVSTAWAYAHWHPHEASVQNWRGCPLFNDLERPVFQKYCTLPVLKQWLLEKGNAEAALMSGSGSTLYGLYADADSAKAASNHLTQEFGETFWTCVTTPAARFN